LEAFGDGASPLAARVDAISESIDAPDFKAGFTNDQNFADETCVAWGHGEP